MTDTQKGKKNFMGIFVFIFFIGFLPIATFFFSYFGLDVHKNIKGEMRFHTDSIRINMEGLTSKMGDTLTNTYFVERIAVVGFWQPNCSIDEIVSAMKEQRAAFGKDDQGKIVNIIHRIDNPTPDSTWNPVNYLLKNSLDTNLWKIVDKGDLSAYPWKTKPQCNTLALLDGRVSRKDKTEGYVNGPILADYYDIGLEEEQQKMLRSITIILPKKARKSIEFKADENLYQ
jgi:hypothetical protein